MLDQPASLAYSIKRYCIAKPPSWIVAAMCAAITVTLGRRRFGPDGRSEEKDLTQRALRLEHGEHREEYARGQPEMAVRLSAIRWATCGRSARNRPFGVPFLRGRSRRRNGCLGCAA